MSLARTLAILLFLPPFAGSATGAPSPQTDPQQLEVPAGDGPWVVRASFSDRGQVQRLAAEMEPWEVHYDRGYVVVGVDREGYRLLLDLGFVPEVDERQTAMLRKPPRRLPEQVTGIPGFPCYRTVEETFAAAAAIVAAHPGLATWTDQGDSWERTQSPGAGYDMRVLRMTNLATPGPKPKFFIMSAVHAREYTPAELATRFAEYLAGQYGADADATWLLDHNEVHLLLQANPDGRKKAESGLSWRKNTDNNFCGNTNSRGIDLNRNFEYQWGCCGGSSTSQCSETFRGPGPASEPEIQAVRNYVRSQFPDYWSGGTVPPDASGLFMDIHSYSQLVLWPWGYTSTVAPNGTALRTLGRKLAWFNDYTPEQAIELYITDGTSDDFAYGDRGIAAYTFELGTSFFQDCGSFESTILPDNFQALLYAAKVTRTPYLTPAGPNTLGLTASPAAVLGGGSVELAATADDTRFNNSNGTEPTQAVTAAAFFVDVPPWAPGATANPMAASDGTFNQTVEGVRATLSTAALAFGRHTVFVRGRDAAGSWGAVSAVFVEVLDPVTAPTVEGHVRETATNVPLSATVSVGSFQAATDASGFYSLRVPPGTYQITAQAPGHAPATVDGVVASSSQTVVQDFSLSPTCARFKDWVETGNVGWTATAPWAITTESSHSSSHSWTDSPGGSYANNRDVSLTSPLLDLTGYSSVTARFWHTYDLEPGFDFGSLEYSTNGGSTWTSVASYSGYGHTTWTRETLSLPAAAGAASVRVRFRFRSDGGVTADGWHLDDIEITGASASCPGATCGVPNPQTAPLPWATTGTTTGAADNYTPATCGGVPVPAGTGIGPDRSQWLRTDVDCQLAVTLHPTDTGAGADDLALYVMTPDCSDPDLRCAQAANASGAGGDEVLSFQALGLRDYFVVVDGAGGAAGPYQISVNGPGCVLVPVRLERFSVE